MSLKATLTSLRAVISTPLIGLFVLIKRLTETPSVTDADSKVFGKNTSDAAALSDAQAFAVTKGESESIAASEAVVLSSGKVIQDLTGITDAGLGTLQDYCGSGYFAEDYVGISWNL